MLLNKVNKIESNINIVDCAAIYGSGVECHIERSVNGIKQLLIDCNDNFTVQIRVIVS